MKDVAQHADKRKNFLQITPPRSDTPMVFVVEFTESVKITAIVGLVEALEKRVFSSAPSSMTSMVLKWTGQGKIPGDISMPAPTLRFSVQLRNSV